MKTRRIIFLLCAMMILLVLPVGTSAEEEQQGREDIYVNATLFWSEHVAGENRVIYPVISGLEDEKIQNALNQEMFTRLHVDDLLARLERIRQQPEDEQSHKTMYMESRSTLSGNLISIMVRIMGEQYDGSYGDRVECFNYDLSTGEEVTKDVLFLNADEAFERLNALVEAQILPELSAYLENNDVLPLPEDSFFLDEQGITFYYPQERFSMISGNVGACAFYYYEIRDALNTQSPLFSQLFASLEGIDVAAIAQAVSEGRMTPLPFKLGEEVGTYLAEYTLLNDPDYTLSSLVYQFEDAFLRGVGLETWMYDEREEEERPITAIRSNRIDFYGIQAGVSTLSSCQDILGAPQETIVYDQEDAIDMLVTPGESYVYVFGSNTLEIHANEQGIVSCLMIQQGAK